MKKKKKLFTKRDIKNFTSGMILGSGIKMASGYLFGPVATAAEIAKAGVSYGAFSVVLDRVCGKVIDITEPKVKKMEREMKRYHAA